MSLNKISTESFKYTANKALFMLNLHPYLLRREILLHRVSR